MFYITNKAWNKIINYAQAAYDNYDSEIGGMLVAIRDVDDDWELNDPIILKQEVSSGNCVLDKDELAKYYSKTGRKLKNKDFRFVWWHSHHTMKAFWSGTDKKAIDEYSDGDFSFALVVNLKGEYKFRVSVWKPFEMHEDVELKIIKASKRIPSSITEEVVSLCNQETITPINNIGSYISPEYRQFNMFQYETAYNDTWDKVNSLNDKLMSGEIRYNTYAAYIKSLNKKLDNGNSGVSVELYPEKDIINKLMCNSPDDMISVIEGNNPHVNIKYGGLPF